MSHASKMLRIHRRYIERDRDQGRDAARADKEAGLVPFPKVRLERGAKTSLSKYVEKRVRQGRAFLYESGDVAFCC